MTWTYSGAPGAGSTAALRDAVRFYVGDTDTTDQLVTDEEIGFALDSSADDARTAASIVARAISASFARQADKEVGDLSVKLSQKSAQYSALAEKLSKDSAKFRGVSPFAGGISITSKQLYEDDGDRVRPAFEVGQFDYRANSTSSLST